MFFVLFSVGIAVGAVVSSFMVWGPHSFHGTNFDGTVIVLGCKVRGDQPSLMLKARLDAAVAFLDQNPESLCIVSGGQGKDEQYPEAVVMKRYLVEQGIDSSRIFEEANSKNTLENLQFSQLLIQEKGLSENIVVITNYFHRYRGQLYAEKAGLKAQTVAGACRFDLEVCYWLREIPAVMKAWFS